LSKKKKIYKILLSRILAYSNFLIASNTKYIFEKIEYFFQNIFRISTSFKQLFFSLFDLPTSFIKLFSTGVILKGQVRHFKFFKKSIFNINPLVMVIRFSFVSFFKKLYAIECLNYSKKQFLFFKKFFNSIKTEIRYMLFKKT
jgi:hypothetical protein